MSSEAFVFKQFTIHQDKCPMKVGTDAVLLGSWTKAQGATRILDVGTGTGILAIMLAQKCNAEIDAIDIDLFAIEQAKKNVELCKWHNRIAVIHETFQDFVKQKAVTVTYDLIVSNPPYFIDSYKSPEEGRSIARHNDFLPFQDLIDGVSKILSPTGKFYVILPTREAQLFKSMAEKYDLKLSDLLRVKTKAENGVEKRHLMKFEFNPVKFEEKIISIEKEGRHNYHEDYIELTKDYYIHF
jgi:tRNA1Val (adenine37-N6)-methyltransferase